MKNGHQGGLMDLGREQGEHSIGQGGQGKTRTGTKRPAGSPLLQLCKYEPRVFCSEAGNTTSFPHTSCFWTVPHTGLSGSPEAVVTGTFSKGEDQQGSPKFFLHPPNDLAAYFSELQCSCLGRVCRFLFVTSLSLGPN